METWVFDDGGRKSAGFRGLCDDCVVRAIAIAAEIPYREVYDEIARRQRQHLERGGRSRQAKSVRLSAAVGRKPSPRSGVVPEVYLPYLDGLGWSWTPTMRIGSGCRVHLRGDELPPGRIIARTSGHLVAVINGVIHDTHDSTRAGTRCVYGYRHR